MSSYTYDAFYRLIEARGRDHMGHGIRLQPPDGNRRDYAFVGHQAHPSDLQALRNYTEHYAYEAVGNFEFVHYLAAGGGRTRRYEYDEDSLIEPGKECNCMIRTRLGDGPDHIETCTYAEGQGGDVHSCMAAINTMNMVWDFEDQLQEVNLCVGGRAYDAAGQRARKVIKSQNGTRRKQRIHLGGFEVYREYNGNCATVTLEREALRVTDDQQRIALVEKRTAGEIRTARLSFFRGGD